MKTRGIFWRDFWLVVAGMALFGLFSTGPYLVALVTLPADRVFLPVRGLNHHVSDAYQYGAYINQITYKGFDGTLIPTAKELADQKSMEYFRSASLFLAASPSLLSDDFRLIYVVGQFMSGSLFFLLPFLIGRMMDLSRMISAAAAAFSFFALSGWWSGIYNYIAYYDSLSIKILLNYAASFLRFEFTNYLYMKSYEILGNNWRYLYISQSGPLFLAYYSALVLFLRQETIRNKNFFWACGLSLAVAIALFAAAYTQPSILPITYSLVACGAFFTAWLEKNLAKAYHLTAILGFSALILILSGYFKDLQATMQVNPLWIEMFERNKFSLAGSSIFISLAGFAFNKYILTGLLMIMLMQRYFKDMRIYILPVIITGMILSSFILFKINDTSSRFFGRGIDLLWVLIFAFVFLRFFFEIFLPSIEQLFIKGGLETFKSRSLVKIAGVIFFAVMVLVPFVGLAKYSYSAAKNNIFSVAKAEWSAYRWLNENVNDYQTVAAVDWEEIAMIPLYSQANLLAGYMVINNRPPIENVKKYCALWKYLSFPKEELETLVRGSVDNYRLHLKRAFEFESVLKPPLLNRTAFNSASFFAGLSRPYVKVLAGVNVTEPDGSINNTFVDKIMEIYDQINPDDFMPQADFIMLSQETAASLPHVIPDEFALVFVSSVHKIYQRKFIP